MGASLWQALASGATAMRRLAFAARTRLAKLRFLAARRRSEAGCEMARGRGGAQAAAIQRPA